MTPIPSPEVIARGLDKARQTPGGWAACCPAHPDKTPSLAIEEHGGKILVHCHAGCPQEAVIEALRKRGLWPKAAPKNGEMRPRSFNGHPPFREFPYANERGQVVFYNVRYADSVVGSDGKPIKFRPWTKTGTGWVMKGTPPLPYRFCDLRAAAGGIAYFAEGERDADTLHGMGYTASSFKGWKFKWNKHVAPFGALIAIGDTDAHGAGDQQVNGFSPGRDVLRFATDEIAKLAGANGKDVTALCAAVGNDKVKAAIDALVTDALGEEAVAEHGWVVGSAIDPENVKFLWRDRFVAGRINIVAGMGDVGKDVFCCTIAACVTTGRDWPDGAPGCEPGLVGIISPEDEPNDTIVPRLLAAGADMDKIRIWCSRSKPSPADMVGLNLIVVSPLINLMDGQKDMNREQDARAFLELLQGILKAQDCTIVGTAHLNKKSDAPVVQRILGASGIANFVRSNWTVQRDDEDKTVRLFMRLKANLSPDTVNGLKFTIRHIGPWSQSIVCQWCGTTDKTPDGVMSAKAAQPRAIGWLKAFLREHGECEWDFIAAAAVSNGLNEETVKKAGHRDSKIIITRRGFPAKSHWRLDASIGQ